MLKQLKFLLDLLPFNGSKLKLGALLALIASIQELVPGVDLLAVFRAILADPKVALTSGLVTLAIGLIHKKLKKKYPEPTPAVIK